MSGPDGAAPRLLITGGSSYLGQHLVPRALAAGWQTTYTWFSGDPLRLAQGRQLDVRDGEAVAALVRRERPDCIIHLAGSNRSEDLTAVIESGTRSVTAAAAAAGARLLFMSTDVVFDGENPPYAEGDWPRPRHAYGRAKAAAEQIAAGVANHLVVRTSLIYGLERIDRGTAWVIDALERGETVTLFTDQMRNPVWVETLAAACLELAAVEATGIVHVAGGQVLSRADFGQRLLNWWGVERRENLRLAPTPAGAPWPLDTTLALERANRLLRTPLPGVDAVLASEVSFK